MSEGQESEPQDEAQEPTQTSESTEKSLKRELTPTRSGFKKTILFNHLKAQTYLFFINFLLKNNGEYTKAIDFLKQHDPEIGESTPQEARKNIAALYKVCRSVPAGRFLFNEKAWFLRLSKNLFIQEEIPQVIVQKKGSKFVVREQPDLTRTPDNFDPMNIMFEMVAITRERIISLLDHERETRDRWAQTPPEQRVDPDERIDSMFSPTLTKLVSEMMDYTIGMNKAMSDRGLIPQVPKKITVDAMLRGTSEAYDKYIKSTDSNSKLLSILKATPITEGGNLDLRVEGDTDGHTESVPAKREAD